MESGERGSRLGPWCGKCLQRAVAGIVGADAGTHFLEECANHAGSGAWGSWLERKNLETVERYLERRRQCVLVFSMASTRNVVVAEMRGVAWKLGHEAGECIGYLAWLDSGHVCRVLRVAEDDLSLIHI